MPLSPVQHYSAGIEAILTMVNAERNFYFGGVVVARNSSGFTSVDDCVGRPISAAASDSFGGYISQIVEFQVLRNQNITFYGTHAAVRCLLLRCPPLRFVTVGLCAQAGMAVVQGLADCGLIRTETLERKLPAYVGTLSVLNEKTYPMFPFRCSTELYPEWPLAVVNRNRTVPDSVVQYVQIRLVSLDPQSVVAQSGQYYGWVPALSYAKVETAMRSIGLLPNTTIPASLPEPGTMVVVVEVLSAVVGILLVISSVLSWQRVRQRMRRRRFAPCRTPMMLIFSDIEGSIEVRASSSFAEGGSDFRTSCW